MDTAGLFGSVEASQGIQSGGAWESKLAVRRAKSSGKEAPGVPALDSCRAGYRTVIFKAL